MLKGSVLCRQTDGLESRGKRTTPQVDSASRLQLANLLRRRHLSTARHQGILPFLVFFASLSFPPTYHKGWQKEPSLLHITPRTCTICWQFTLQCYRMYAQDLTLVVEPIPVMKYRRRTGENSRKPERVEHMGSFNISRQMLPARKSVDTTITVRISLYANHPIQPQWQ